MCVFAAQLVSRVYLYVCRYMCLFSSIVAVIVMLTFLIVRQLIRLSIDILASSLPVPNCCCCLPTSPHPSLTQHTPPLLADCLSCLLPLLSLLDFNLLNYSQFASCVSVSVLLPTCLTVSLYVCVYVTVCLCMYFVSFCFSFSPYSCFCTFCACFDFLIFLP